MIAALHDITAVQFKLTMKQSGITPKLAHFERHYFTLAAVVLLASATSKIPDILNMPVGSAETDAVTGFRIKQLVGAIVALNISCASLLLSKIASTYKHIMLLWLGSVFGVYHAIMQTNGVTVCPCFGGAMQKLALPTTLNWLAITFVAVVLSISGLALMVSLSRRAPAMANHGRAFGLGLLVMLQVFTGEAQCASANALLVEGVATNYSYVGNEPKPRINTAQFTALIGLKGWSVKIKATNIDSDYGEVGGHEGKVYTLLKTEMQTQTTNTESGVKHIKRKASTAIVEAGAFPHTYWCNWATPIWYSLASGIQLKHSVPDQEQYAEPLFITEGNGNLLHNIGFTQRVHIARNEGFPFAPISVAWLHDGILRDWKRPEDSWVFPPQMKKLQFPFADGYTNATFTTAGSSNYFGWSIPTQTEYIIFARVLPSGYKTNQPPPTRISQRYSLHFSKVSAGAPMADYRPAVSGDFAFVKDSRFSASEKVFGVNYFQRNAWKTDREVLNSVAYLNRKKQIEIVNDATLKHGPTVIARTTNSSRRPLLIGLIAVTIFAVFLAVIARTRQTKHSSHS